MSAAGDHGNSVSVASLPEVGCGFQAGSVSKWIGWKRKAPRGPDLFFGVNKTPVSPAGPGRPFAAVVFRKCKKRPGHERRIPVRVSYFGSLRRAEEAAFGWYCQEHGLHPAVVGAVGRNASERRAWLRGVLGARYRRAVLFAPFPLPFVYKPAIQSSVHCEPRQSPALQHEILDTQVAPPRENFVGVSGDITPAPVSENETFAAGSPGCHVGSVWRRTLKFLLSFLSAARGWARRVGHGGAWFIARRAWRAGELWLVAFSV
jgi:hypothetical protein